MSRVIILVACAIVLLSASLAEGAAVPQKINYQAVLLDDVGDPVTDPVDITFRIYDVESGGVPLWEQTLYSVQPDVNGQFSVILGEPPDSLNHTVFTGEQLWLGIQVGTDTEMSPRTELVSSAYSFRVNTVDQAEAGTIYGALTVDESSAKAINASITLLGTALDSVYLSPADGIILRSTNESGNQILSADVSSLDQSAQLTISAPDGNAEAVLTASSAEFSSNVKGKKFVYGVEGLKHLGASETDILGKWADLAPGQSYIGMTDYSAKAEGASIRIRPPSADLKEVFSVKNNSGDATFQLESKPDSGASMSFYSTAAKAAVKKATLATEGLAMFGSSESEELLKVEEEIPGVVSISGTDYSAKAAGASIKIKPPTASQAEVFTVSTSTGDPTFQLESDPTNSGASMSFYSTAAKASTKKTEISEEGYFAFGSTEDDTALKISGESITLKSTAAKLGEWIKISSDGIFFVNAAKGETLMTITAYGNVIGKGQIAMGQSMSNDGDFANVLGFGNTADGDSAAVTGGYDNRASGDAAIVAGGRQNEAFGYASFATGYRDTASGGWSTVGGGHHNKATSSNATVSGGSYNVASGLYSTVCGGGGGNANYGNKAIGEGSIVAGGRWNEAAASFSFAAGFHARVDTNDQGTFVWADNQAGEFVSTDQKQFLIRASNGVGINVNNPSEDLDVAGTARLRGIPSTGLTFNTVVVDGNGQLRKYSPKSSRRYKEDIRELGVDPDKVLQMDPVRFAWKENGMEDVGLIAEDVAKLIPELVIYDEENRPDGVKYDKVVFYLLAALKDLRAENEALKGQLGELSRAVETISAKQSGSKSGDDKLTLNR